MRSEGTLAFKEVGVRWVLSQIILVKIFDQGQRLYYSAVRNYHTIREYIDFLLTSVSTEEEVVECTPVILLRKRG